LGEFRKKPFIDRYLLTSTELNVLNLILSNWYKRGGAKKVSPKKQKATGCCVQWLFLFHRYIHAIAAALIGQVCLLISLDLPFLR
jgi:hypothetical protein